VNVVEAALRGIAGDLDRQRQPWALVGGFAVSVRAEPRFTRDVDVAAAVPGDDAAEALVRSLFRSGYRLLASVEHEATGRLATARLTCAPNDLQDVSGEVVVDLLFASSGIESEIVAAAEPIEILPGLIVPVAQAGHLIAVKVLARDDLTRPQDLADLHALLSTATSDDLSLARDSIQLITHRGYHRNRDLAEGLDQLVRRTAN
jgi:hypothetical protein